MHNTRNALQILSVSPSKPLKGRDLLILIDSAGRTVYLGGNPAYLAGAFDNLFSVNERP